MTITVTKGSVDLLLGDEHAAYVPDARNNFDLYTAQVHPQQRDGRYIYDFTEPRTHALTAGGSWWFPSVPEVDATNAHYIEVLDVGPGDVVWDIGAYSGRSTLAFMDAAKRVVALEPDPTNYECLKKNLEGRRVDILNLALWNRDGQELFEADGQQGSGITANRQRHRILTKTVTPKTLMRATCPPTVVKVDIEGAEYKTVPAFVDIFDTTRPRFLIECHHDHGGIFPSRLHGFFSAHDYNSKVIDQPEGGPFPLLHAWPR